MRSIAWVFLTCLTASLFAPHKGAAQTAPTQISVGYAIAGEFLPLFVAIDEGYFAKRNLEVKPVSLTVLSVSPAGLMSNSLQIAASNPPILLQAAAGGIELVIVSGTSRHTVEHETVSLMARTDSGIHTAADLVGKKVGIPGLRATYDLLLGRWLTTRNVDLAKVQFIEATLPQMRDLLRSGQLDAAAVAEPNRGRIVADGTGYRVSDFIIDLAPDIIAGFWTSTRTWADANPRAVAAFQAGLAEGIRFVQENPDRAKQIETKYFGRASEVRLELTQEVRPVDLKLFQDLMIERGLLTDKTDLDRLILPIAK
jgi:NitT/TauT family transport system substrate-binding protein